MKCRKCGTEYSGQTVCPKCGAPAKGGSHSKKGSRKRAAGKGGKTRMIIAAALAAAAVCAALVLIFLIIPKNRYDKGLEYYNAAEWHEAAALLSKTGWKDSEDLCAFAEGMDASDNEQWEKAAEYFSLSGQENSVALSQYTLGRARMQSGKWSEAALLFESSGYGDSADRAEYCRALGAWVDGDIENALEHLDHVDFLNSSELFADIKDASFFDSCFLRLFEQTLTESFELAGNSDASLNRSDALDISYYAFYDIFADVPEEDFTALFYDSELAGLASRYIGATLTQWSVTDYDGYISAGHEEEYYALAAERRAAAAEICEKYGVLDGDPGLELFLAQGEVLDAYYEDVYLPLYEELLQQLTEKPFSDSGVRYVSVGNDSEEPLVFSACLRYHNSDGTYAFDRADNITVEAGDAVLISMQNYVPRVDCDIYLNIISSGGSGLTAYGVI